jgi:hypothetical protein
MMGGKTPETCWAVNKRQDNKLKICCIRLVIYLNCTITHGLSNLTFKTTVWAPSIFTIYLYQSASAMALTSFIRWTRLYERKKQLWLVRRQEMIAVPNRNGGWQQ